MKIFNEGPGHIANFNFKDGKPHGSTAENGKHLGFFFESVIYYFFRDAYGDHAVTSTYNISEEMREACDVVVTDDYGSKVNIEIKSRRSIDGSFKPEYLLKKYNKQYKLLKELNQPFAILVGQYENGVNDVVGDLAYFDIEKGIYTSPPEHDPDTVSRLSDWYDFYAYIGHGESGGWINMAGVLGMNRKPCKVIADLFDPQVVPNQLTSVLENIKHYAESNRIEGTPVLTYEEYVELYFPSANVEPEPEALSSEMLEPEAPSPIEVLEAKIAKHREIARRHHQEAEDLNDSLLKATSNQIIEAVFSEMKSVSKHFESIEKSFLGIKTNYESLTSKVNGNFKFINEVKATLKVICQKVNKFETQTEDKFKVWVKFIAHLSDKVEDYKKSTDTDINANKDNIDLLDDRLKELSERLTNFECDLLLMKKSHLSNEKREHKNRELIDHLYAQLGEDQDG